jgi:hypothetical protein
MHFSYLKRSFCYAAETQLTPTPSQCEMEGSDLEFQYLGLLDGCQPCSVEQSCSIRTCIQKQASIP